MAASHKENVSTSEGLTNSSLYNDYVDGAVPLRCTDTTHIAPLSTPFSQTLVKQTLSPVCGRYPHQSAVHIQMHELDDDVQHAMAQHRARMARYQERERECRSTLSSLETRIHQLERRRWEMEMSQQAQQKRQAQLDLAYDDHQQKHAVRAAARQEEEHALVAQWQQKRAQLTASLRAMDEQMRVVENQQQWEVQQLEAQRALVTSAEALAQNAHEAAARVRQDAESSARPVRLAADALKREVQLLEQDADERLTALRCATAEANAALAHTQGQLEDARHELTQMRAHCASESRTYEALKAQKEETAVAVQTQQAALERVTERLNATCAEGTAREQRAAVRCDQQRSEEVRLAKVIDQLNVTYEERARVVEALRVQEKHLESSVARMAVCAKHEAELTQRESELSARHRHLEEQHAALREEEQALCASLDKLDEEARYAATLAAATTADLVRGVQPTRVPAPSVTSWTTGLVTLSTRVTQHATALSALCEQSLMSKVDVFLDASDAIRHASRDVVEGSAPTSSVLHV